jgi:3'-phosphoadenosine 5'-phosphosulfate sulfotransferase (PAPS reductase)/FAD synthetase
MTENEFILADRIAKIKSTIEKYGEENFYISFSGGKDSTVLSALVDMAVPNNKIPRVYANTGIEYKLILDFVKKVKAQSHTWELIILTPKTPIKPMLEKEGYPFKSKEHAAVVASYQGGNKNGKWIKRYTEKTGRYAMPECLRYQFTEECTLKISDKCCERLKEGPLREWQKKNNKPYGIVGIMRTEGGRRSGANCMAFRGNKLVNFQPLALVTKDWEEWFIKEYDIELSEIYLPPYNFTRTGCKGCPFNPNLQKDLDVLEKFFPGERKQCEIIWAPVYAEYRRLGYRLKPLPVESEYHQVTVDEWYKTIE